MYDANSILQASVTKTASFNSASYSIPTGTPRRGLKARVIVTAASGTTPTFDTNIQKSDDGGSTWQTIASGPQLTGTGEIFIPFETSSPAIRLAVVIAGTTPSFTYQADLGLSRP